MKRPCRACFQLLLHGGKGMSAECDDIGTGNGMMAIGSDKEDRGRCSMRDSLLADQNGDAAQVCNRGGLDSDDFPHAIWVIAPDLLQERVDFLCGGSSSSK